MIYEAVIMPVLLYKCECVTWTENLLASFEVFQNHMMRNIRGNPLLIEYPFLNFILRQI